jgi:preprotein translocase subunit SecG
MFTTFIILILLVCVLLVLVVLIQNPKGGGLTSQFTGAGSSQLFGVKKTGDLLEQLTWGFAGAIAVLALTSIFFLEAPSGDTQFDDGLGTATPAAAPRNTTPLQQPAPVAPAPSADTTK